MKSEKMGMTNWVHMFELNFVLKPFVRGQLSVQIDKISAPPPRRADPPVQSS
jgi:hypothetical protein